MLRIIEPPSHVFYQSKIDTLLDLFNVYQNLKLPLEQQTKTTFMVAENDKCGVYGGAFLCKKKAYAFDDNIAKIISSLHSNKRKVWAANLCLCIEEDETLSSFDKLDLYQDFYQSLFKKFVAFGKKENANFLVLSLHPTDYFKTITYGYWPFLFEVQPKDSLDGLFHGILALKSKKQAPYKQAWPSLECLRQLGRRS